MLFVIFNLLFKVDKETGGETRAEEDWRRGGKDFLLFLKTKTMLCVLR